MTPSPLSHSSQGSDSFLKRLHLYYLFTSLSPCIYPSCLCHAHLPQSVLSSISSSLCVSLSFSLFQCRFLCLRKYISLCLSISLVCLSLALCLYFCLFHSLVSLCQPSFYDFSLSGSILSWFACLCPCVSLSMSLREGRSHE